MLLPARSVFSSFSQPKAADELLGKGLLGQIPDLARKAFCTKSRAKQGWGPFPSALGKAIPVLSISTHSGAERKWKVSAVLSAR